MRKISATPIHLRNTDLFSLLSLIDSETFRHESILQEIIEANRPIVEAREAGAFLVFDEADSLLGDRRTAHQAWEISQVNEMLTQMERHPFPFACTTNDVDALDPAAARARSWPTGSAMAHRPKSSA